MFYHGTMKISFHDEQTLPDMHRRSVVFVALGIGIDGFGPCSSMGVSRDGNLIGAVIFHDYQPSRGTIEMSIHGERGWISRRVVNACMWYVFECLGCQMVLGQSSSRNHAALSLDRRIFANEVVVPRLMGRDEDGHVFSLTDDQWRLHRLNKSRKIPE